MNKTTLPDKRTYETYTSKDEWEWRVKNLEKRYRKVERGAYDWINWKVYYIIYKE